MAKPGANDANTHPMPACSCRICNQNRAPSPRSRIWFQIRHHQDTSRANRRHWFFVHHGRDSVRLVQWRFFLVYFGLLTHPPAAPLSAWRSPTRSLQKTVRRPGCLTPVSSGLLHSAPLRGQPRLAPAVDPLLCAPFRSRNSPETGRALRQPAPAPKVATSGLYLRRCNHGQHEDPPTAPTRDVNRDSETDSANGGWLRRLVRHRVNAHKSNSAASNENETDNRQQHKDNANHSQNHRNVKTETAWR